MLFRYTYIDKQGEERKGTIDALNEDVAINSLQSRGLVLTSIESEDSPQSILDIRITIFERVSTREVVILSRQIATLFQAKISALRVFRLLSAEVENKLLQDALKEVSSDISAGSSMSEAFKKHPRIFSSFYVSMVAAGEESGKLDETFSYLADYLDRNYEVTSKARNALIYPTFVIATFIGVMVLMLTTVIPRISTILTESGQSIPFYTQVTLAASSFLVNYGFLLLAGLLAGAYFFWRYIQTPAGDRFYSRLKLGVPVIGNLYQKLYLARIADNMNTMLSSGISMVRTLESTRDVVDNRIYRDILDNAIEKVKSGTSVSDALSAGNDEIPSIMTQMIKIGEETGELGNILKTLSGFYQREVTSAVDTLVSLIEPALIILLGLGVGFLLASVLIPIYSIGAAF